MTAPTPAERAQAKRLAYLHPGFSPGRVNAIAQALAHVRAEAVAEVTAKYQAVADEFGASHERCWENDANQVAYAYGMAADRIREVGQS